MATLIELLGGGWYSDPGGVRSAYRYGVVPTLRDNGQGFRLARSS